MLSILIINLLFKLLFINTKYLSLYLFLDHHHYYYYLHFFIKQNYFGHENTFPKYNITLMIKLLKLLDLSQTRSQK